MSGDRLGWSPVRSTRTGPVLAVGRPQRRLRWGLLAVTVAFGVVAMHSVAGGQHSAHASPVHGSADTIAAPFVGAVSTAANPARSAGPVGHEAHVPDAAAGAAKAQTANHSGAAEHAASCDDDGCGFGNGGLLCLALLISLLIAAVARRTGTWTVSGVQHLFDRTRMVMMQRPVLRAPSPLHLGISRT